MDKSKEFEALNDNELIQIYKTHEDEETRVSARNTVIMRQSSGVERAAWKHFKWRNACGLDDLIQESWRGVMKAVDKFDPSYNVPFNYYAYQWSDALVRYAIYSKGRTIRTPVPKIRALASIKAAIEVHKEKYGDEPSLKELNSMTGISMLRIRKTLSSEVHLFSTSPTTEQEKRECSIRSETINPFEACERNENHEIVKKLIESQLDELERRVLISRMGLFGMQKKTLDELSIENDYTKPGIRAVEQRALDKLKRAYNRFEDGMITI